MSGWVTLLTAILGGSGASVVVALISRPKTRAETNAIVTESEVKVSGQAQEWAKIFAAQAETAERRAKAAEEKAAHAEARCDELESRMDDFARFARAQNVVIETLGGTPPEPPESIRDHL